MLRRRREIGRLAGIRHRKDNVYMRYTEIDLQIEDIMWFGIDLNGYIFSCTTAGAANVPEFVCKSKEQTEFLADYFIENWKRQRQKHLIPIIH